MPVNALSDFSQYPLYEAGLYLIEHLSLISYTLIYNIFSTKSSFILFILRIKPDRGQIGFSTIQIENRTYQTYHNFDIYHQFHTGIYNINPIRVKPFPNYFQLSARIPEKCDIYHTIEKVLDLYRLLFVYSGLPLCGGTQSQVVQHT